MIHFLFKIAVNHLGEKPHKCDECGLAFSLANKLNVHKRLIHEGKKYSCDICGMEYNSPKSVKRHSLKVHGVEQTRKYKYDKKSVIPVASTPHLMLMPLKPPSSSS